MWGFVIEILWPDCHKILFGERKMKNGGKNGDGL